MGVMAFPRRTVLILTFLFVLVPLGCSAAGSKNPETRPTQKTVDQQIEDLKRQLSELNIKVLTSEIENKRFKNVTLDPSVKGYGRVDTSAGFFLVSLEDAVPYVDGYKITINVGNPSTATYSGIKVDLKHGKRFDIKDISKDPKLYDQWKKGLKERTFNISKELKPGTWNKVDLVVAPAKGEDIAYLEMSLETDSVKLRVE